MIISATKKFIFIHIPKAAGTSVRSALGQYATVSMWQHTSKTLPMQVNPELEKHVKAITLRKYFSEEDWNSYFKFAFVRNPWDWFVSSYCYIKMDRTDPRHMLANNKSFAHFLHWFSECNPVTYPAKLGQLSYVTDAQESKIVNFVGRVETMRDDFSIICSKIGVAEHLPRLNMTRHARYRDFYTPETRKIIESLFYKDIAEFGYTF